MTRRAPPVPPQLSGPRDGSYAVPVGGRAGFIARALVVALGAAAVWGLVLGWWFGASLVRGVLVGLYAWGPAIVLSVQWRAPVETTPSDAFIP